MAFYTKINFGISKNVGFSMSMDDKLFLLTRLRGLIDAEILSVSGHPGGPADSSNNRPSLPEGSFDESNMRFELRVIDDNKSTLIMELVDSSHGQSVSVNDQGRANAFYETFGSDLLQTTFRQGEPSEIPDPLDEAEIAGIQSIDLTSRQGSSAGVPSDNEGLKFFNF